MYHFWGIWGFWWFWIFWLILLVLFFSFLTPVRRSRWMSYRQMETPLQILQRRYAAGEMSHEEYEERRTKLLRDANEK